jgi:GPN-loop GTPase
MRHCQLVIGPAGTGKSTFCKTMHEHCEAKGRALHIVNLDPAAEHFEYPVSLDIRELITLDDVSEELQLGPNGGLIYCMEYLIENIEWLHDACAEFGDEDYLIFDCPGQLELYSHVPVMRGVVDELRRMHYNPCCVYLIDALFLADPPKFIAGVLASLSAMASLELPHINVLSKCDLVEPEVVERYLGPDTSTLLADLVESTPPWLQPLNAAMSTLIEDYSMVAFVPLDISDEESIEFTLNQIDFAIQYGEDLEPRERPQEMVDDLIGREAEDRGEGLR